MADGNGQRDETTRNIAQAKGTIISGAALVAIGKITAGPLKGFYAVTVGEADDPDPEVFVILTADAVADMVQALRADPDIAARLSHLR
jgi:hypothetical protein